MLNSRFFLMIAAFAAAAVLTGAEITPGELSPEQFVLLARNPNQISTYAKLIGTLQHRRRGSDTVSMPLYFGIIIRPDRSTAQLIIDRDESYSIGQSREIGGSTVIPTGKNDTDKLGRAGIRASDLTMGFLFYPLVKELESTTLGAMVPCRVMLVEAPDKSETVKVYLARDYAFPLKAEFFHPDEKQPYRTLETGGFTKKNELYYTKRIRVEGPGWTTRIDFDGDAAELGRYDAAKPARVFRPLETNLK